MSKKKLNIKENFTFTKKSPRIKLLLNENPWWKITFEKQFSSTFYFFFITCEHLSDALTLRKLSSLYINGLEEGCAHLPETLFSTYEIKLKLGPVIAFDKRRRYRTLSLCSHTYMLITDKVRRGIWSLLFYLIPL